MIDPSQRGGLYGFFSRLFIRELDDDVVAMLRGPLGRELFPELESSGELDPLTDSERRQAVFDADYVHLTVVNLVPYGSFYTREDGMVESGSVNSLVEFMREFGFEVDLEAARSLSPDHIGIELEAMAQLCAAEAEAIARPDPVYAQRVREVELRLLREHVLTWIPVYLFAVERCAHTHLYREAARACMEFVGSDHEVLSQETVA